MGAPVFPSSHSLPPTFVVPPKSGWVSLTLGEFVREPHLAVDLSLCSQANFNNKVYIRISICLTTVPYFSIDSEFNRGRKRVLFIGFTKSNMRQVIALQKHVQSIKIKCSMEGSVLYGMCVHVHARTCEHMERG